MAKAIAITFSLGAALSSGFRGAFKSAAQASRNVAASIREMENSATGRLGKSLASQGQKLRQTAVDLRQARSSLAGLQGQALASGTATGMLARQITLADEKVRNLENSLKKQTGAMRKTAAQAATTAGSISKLTADYKKLEAQAARRKNLAAALGANQANAEALRSQRGDLQSRMAGAMATTAAIAVPAKLSIDFDDAIAQVGAVANASDEDMQRLTATARQLGRDTMFSASQAAEGMKYLSMAGFDASETISAMPGMLELAAAGNTDLGRTADIASDILSAFKLKAEDMGQVSDTLARTFTTSNTSLEMLGDTMKYVGPVAASVGMSLQDTSAMAGMLGNVGIKASQAGTVMRAALLRLAAPPKMAADSLAALAGVGEDEIGNLVDEITDAQGTLDSLGMTTRDAEGNMRPMVDILEELNARTASMGTAEKAEVFKKVFGTEASAGMIALAEQAAVTVDKYGNQIKDAWGKPTNALRAYMGEVNNYEGTGARIAERMNATTGGSLRRLRSAWEDAAIAVGNIFAPAISALAGLFSRIGNGISWFTERFPRLSKGVGLAVGAFGALSVGAVALGFVLNFVRTSLNSLNGAYLRMVAAQVPATASTAAFGAASTAAGVGARFFAGGLRTILTATGVGAVLVGLGYGISLLIDNWETVVTVMQGAWNWLTQTWSQLGVFFSELGSNLYAAFAPFWNWIAEIATQARDAVVYAWNTVTEFFAALWVNISGAFASGWNNITSGAMACWDWIAGIWNGAAGFFSGIVDSIASVFSGFFDWLASKFQWVFDTINAVKGFFGKIGDAVGNAWNAAFGDSSARAAASVEKPAAEAAQAGVQTGAAKAAKTPPAFTPVSKAAVDAASQGAAKATKKSGGKKSGSRASGSSGGAASAASSASGSPITVVSLGGDNSKPITTFIPAGASSSKIVSASSGAMAKANAKYAIPDAPVSGKRKTQSQTSQSGGISLTQNFDVMSNDPQAFKKVMESLRPDFEALVRRALDKIASDKRRTAYAQ